ncbi:hypothetical protein TNCV_2777391 [Trichonephila clavipes]|nr:hypothetical protein TNCV_2777391 [Trichonephila clavipes]
MMKSNGKRGIISDRIYLIQVAHQCIQVKTRLSISQHWLILQAIIRLAKKLDEKLHGKYTSDTALNLSRLQRPPVRVVWKLGEGVPAQALSSSLDHGSKLRGPSPIALMQLYMKSAAEAHRMLSNTYGEAAISERTSREWFQRFKNGGFDVEDQHGI